MKFKILTRPGCKWCLKSKKLMDAFGFEYEEEVFETEEQKAWFKENIATTFPQIYKTDISNPSVHIGGYDELEKLITTEYL